MLDPDTYVNGRAVLSPKQRKMIRHVDGTARIVERQGPREPMPGELLAKINDLAVRVKSDIGWTIDDLDKVWLLSFRKELATKGT